MRMTDNEYMELAYIEACQSLKEGNHGFGAVIIDGYGEVIALSHDKEKTEKDSTLHAEITAISKASKILGHDLVDCTIFSTHEPCPMCATAIYWSGIRNVVYSFPIKEALKENRKRIGIGIQEIFDRTDCDVAIAEKVLFEKCKYLYQEDVRNEIKKLRDKDVNEIENIGRLIKEKRINWLKDHLSEINGNNLVDKGYTALLKKLGICENDAPIIVKDDKSITFHSINYCPTLEACKILGYDTRIICKHLLENATDEFLKVISPRLKFERNYEKMRPYYDYCEEIIKVE